MVAAQPAAIRAESAEWRYAVEPGDTLWTVSRDHLLGVRYVDRLQRLNQVPDPLRLKPGSELRIPIEWTRWQPLPIRIDGARGDVAVLRAGTPSAARAGDALAEGEAVRTGGGASAVLAVQGRGSVLLSPDCELTIERARLYGRSGVADIRLRLQRGNAEPQVRDLVRGSRFEIVTPAAVTAVRGTDFRVGTLDEGRKTRVELTAGLLAVATAAVERRAPPALVLTPGQGAVAGDGPPKATALLPPLDLTNTPALIDRLPSELPLPAAPGVVAWRAQVVGAAGALPYFDGVVAAPRVRFPDIADGRYSLRVRGIDAQGLEGADALRDFEIDARPEPPFLSDPARDAQLADGNPTFRWSRSTVAGTRYRFQLASGAAEKVEDTQSVGATARAAFAAPRTDVTVTEAQVKLETALAPGRYRWRVAAVDPAEGQGPFSDPQALRVLVPGPAVDAPAVAEGEVVFRWRAGEDTVSYEFQFARDAAFADMIVTQVTRRPEVRLPRPDGGAYYMRVRTIEADGVAGPYGATQRVDVPERPNYWLLLIPLSFLLLLL